MANVVKNLHIEKRTRDVLDGVYLDRDDIRQQPFVRDNEWSNVWRPLLEQWELVGRGFSDAGMQNRALLVLHDALAAHTQEETGPAEAAPSAGQPDLRSAG